MHRARNENFYRVFIERIRQRRGECMSLIGLFGHETTRIYVTSLKSEKN